MDGILNVFKPRGITSFGVIRQLRRILQIKKIGHAGTLDPEAEGVLIVCVGKATKTIDYIMNTQKEYLATLVLGAKTDTQDFTGDIIGESKKLVTQDDIKGVVYSFIGDQYQVPPMYSALKVRGERLYNLARKGIEIERRPRKISIPFIEIVKVNENKEVTFKVACSKGTYIRTLCEDIGEKLGTFGFMGSLTRTRVGNFELTNALSLQRIQELYEKEMLNPKIIKIETIFENYEKINLLDEATASKYLSGVSVELCGEERSIEDEQLVAVLRDGCFIGVGVIFHNNGKYILRSKKCFYSVKMHY